jgi:hypothetical protein
MRSHEHQAAAERIERSMGKCSAELDHELLIEGAMLAGAHRLNARLHDQGFLKMSDDLVHTYLLTVNECRRLSVAQPDAMAALGAIEDLRPAFVRGDAAGGVEAARAAIGLLRAIREADAARQQIINHPDGAK